MDIHRYLRTVIASTSILVSANTVATVDAETPEQVLEMVRLFLSNPVIAKEVAEIADNGCLWTSEVVWFGSGDRVSEGVYTTGGGFTIYYTTKSGNKLQRAYSWEGLWRTEGRTVTKVLKSDGEASEIDCS